MVGAAGRAGVVVSQSHLSRAESSEDIAYPWGGMKRRGEILGFKDNSSDGILGPTFVILFVVEFCGLVFDGCGVFVQVISDKRETLALPLTLHDFSITKAL